VPVVTLGKKSVGHGIKENGKGGKEKRKVGEGAFRRHQLTPSSYRVLPEPRGCGDYQRQKKIRRGFAIRETREQTKEEARHSR